MINRVARQDQRGSTRGDQRARARGESTFCRLGRGRYRSSSATTGRRARVDQRNSGRATPGRVDQRWRKRLARWYAGSSAWRSRQLSTVTARIAALASEWGHSMPARVDQRATVLSPYDACFEPTARSGLCARVDQRATVLSPYDACFEPTACSGLCARVDQRVEQLWRFVAGPTMTMHSPARLVRSWSGARWAGGSNEVLRSDERLVSARVDQRGRHTSRDYISVHCVSRAGRSACTHR